MIRTLTFYLMIVAMVTRGTIATRGDDDYEDDVRFDYLKDWIAEVQSNLRKERETRNKLNRDVVELMGESNKRARG